MLQTMGSTLLFDALYQGNQSCRASEGGGESGSWTGWRGSNRTAMVDPVDWPQSLDSDHLIKQWEVPLEEGYSGPLIQGDQVFVTESRKSTEEEWIHSLDRTSGRMLWSERWKGAMSVPFFAASNGSWIRSTPIVDGPRIYVGGMLDTLTCLDSNSGKTLYSVDFAKRHQSPLPAFGQVCSPILDQGKLYIQSGGGLLCVDASSGETIWRSLVETDSMMGSAFSSPIIATLHGTRQLIVQTRTNLCGVNLENGQVLWSQPIESFRGMNILTPSVWNDCVFTSSYGGKSWLFEFTPKDSGTWDVKERWTGKAEAYMSSPIVIGDHLYLHLRNQRFTCLDLGTGTEKWRSRPYGKYWSTISNGKQILALDENGKLMLIAANPNKYELIDQREVSDQECWAHLALVNGQVYVRHLHGIVRFNWS